MAPALRHQRSSLACPDLIIFCGPTLAAPSFSLPQFVPAIRPRLLHPAICSLACALRSLALCGSLVSLCCFCWYQRKLPKFLTRACQRNVYARSMIEQPEPRSIRSSTGRSNLVEHACGSQLAMGLPFTCGWPVPGPVQPSSHATGLCIRIFNVTHW